MLSAVTRRRKYQAVKACSGAYKMPLRSRIVQRPSARPFTVTSSGIRPLSAGVAVAGDVLPDAAAVWACAVSASHTPAHSAIHASATACKAGGLTCGDTSPIRQRGAECGIGFHAERRAQGRVTLNDWLLLSSKTTCITASPALTACSVLMAMDLRAPGRM